MISAKEASNKTKDVVNAMQKELVEKLLKVIDAAVMQGSCKSVFVPRNAFECDAAMSLLTANGYIAELKRSTDQRDSDRIEISWGDA